MQNTYLRINGFTEEIKKVLLKKVWSKTFEKNTH